MTGWTVSWYGVDQTDHGYHGVNLDEVQPLADIRDCAYMSDRGGVVMMWAKSLPRAVGLQYTSSQLKC